MIDPSREGGVRLPVIVRPAGLDHWSAIRELHAFSFRKVIEPALEPEQSRAVAERIAAPDYTDLLLAQDLQTAWYEDALVGTAGWMPADDSGVVARLTSVVVSPLFQRLGVGRTLVAAIEARARSAGFESFAVRSYPQVSSFFETLGYERSSQGVSVIGDGDGVPVVYLRKLGEAAPGHDAPGARTSPADGVAG
ncbi:MAG: GNAT family N-acetyltransferase [Proteobacteria bacterium]|nr:GNAT family N-acetyltransferase [Pseudomonadota bacterium]